MRTTITTVLATATLLACAACTSSDPQDPVTTPAATPTPTVATSTPTPTASPTPASTAVTADGVIDRTDEDLGIVFTDLPDVTGPAIDALNTYTLFESDFWKATTTSKIPAELEQLTSPKVYDLVKTQVDTNKKNGYTMGGTNRIAITEVKDVDSTSATIVGCHDFDDWQITKKDGSTEEPPAHLSVTVTMSRPPEGLWQADSYVWGDAC